MLLKPFHGWRIKEIHKLTAIRTLSPHLNPVLFFCCQNLPPTSNICFTHQTTKFPLSTSFVATGSSAAVAAAAAAYDSGSPEPDPNTHFENPNLNVESLRESSDEERSSVFTFVSEDGTCDVYVVRRHSSQGVSMELYPADASMLESLKRNPKVVNKLEVHPRHDFDVASEEAMKYGGKVMPGDLSEQVANMLEVYLGRGFRVAYEEAIKYGGKFMWRHFPLQVILWEKMPLSKKIALIRLFPFFQENVTIKRPRIYTIEMFLYLAVAVAGVVAILSRIYFGWKK